MKRILYLCCIFIAGCAPSVPPQPSTVAENAVVDSLNRTIRLAQTPRRIVSLTPANTEILFALGCDEQIVGITESCNFPEATSEKPKVATFVGSTNLELILNAKPDLVLAGGAFQRSLIERLEQTQIPVAAIDAGQLSDLWMNIEKVGKLTGREERAANLATTMRKELAAVAQRVARLPRKKVFYAVDEAPTTIGPKSFISEVIAMAGGENIFADAKGDYPQVSREEILKRQPEVILYPKLGHSGRETETKLLAQLRLLPSAKIHGIEVDLISRPGPRLVEAAKQIAEILHPSR